MATIVGKLNPLNRSATTIRGPKIVTKDQQKAARRERRLSHEQNERMIAYLSRQVEVINICHLMDKMELPADMPYGEQMERVEQWAEGANACIYEMTRDHFSIWRAREIAARQGFKKVIVSDLS